MFRFFYSIICSIFGLMLFNQQTSSQNNFKMFFEDKSLRIDFSLNGNHETQSAALQQIREEPIWGGPHKNLIDPFEYGGYFVKIYDDYSNLLLYTKGFNTLFEEWQTTDQAKTEIQSWTNSISIPYPRKSIKLELLARNKKTNQFEQLLNQTIDPNSIFIDRSPLKKYDINQIQYKGAYHSKVDLVFLPEGYSESEMIKFAADVQRFTESLFSTPPFNDRREDFNIWSVNIPSEESGVDISGKGIFKNTALNAGFYTLGVERYLTTPDIKSIRDAVWNIPCDAIFILVNSDLYGGGGMYNFYAISTADNARTSAVFLHEFGHSFAGLADEYFNSEIAYNDFYSLTVEPWEPNITTLVNFGGKWEDMLAAGIPVPTPVQEPYATNLGVFEGGGYVAKDIYRPMNDCMMRNYAPFCPVCSRAISKMIDYLSDK